MSARTKVPWSSWKVPANLPVEKPSRRLSVSAPVPVFTTVAVSSSMRPLCPSSTSRERSGWAKPTAKAPVSIVNVEPGTIGARTAEASEVTPGAAA